jgi:hypothetical protein
VADIIYLSEGYRKGRPKGTLTDEPREPNKVMTIVRLRDKENMRWRQIGDKMGMTHQGPYLLYKRWRDWAYSQKKA